MKKTIDSSEMIKLLVENGADSYADNEIASVDRQLAILKTRCVASGHEWNSASNSCLYTYNITVPVAVYSQPASSANAQWGSGQVYSNQASEFGNEQGAGPANTPCSVQSSDTVDNFENSPASTGSNDPTRFIPVFVTREGLSSWSKQEDACEYAQNAAIRRAETECRNEQNGIPATVNDISEPMNVNCQSCNQTSSGNWRCSGNVILQCRLPDPITR